MPSKPQPSKQPPRVIYWFRTDLRLHDSPALHAALALQPAALFPIWTWDPAYAYGHTISVGPNRWRFLNECQRDVDAGLRRLNPKQRLFVLRGAPDAVFPELFRRWRVSHLVFEGDTDAYARERDERVGRLAQEAGVVVIVKMGRTLFDPQELVRLNKGPTMSMSQVLRASVKIGDGVPAKPLDAPTRLPDPGTEEEMDLGDWDYEPPAKEPDVNAVFRSKGTERQYDSIMGPKGDFAVPTLEEMGIDPKDATTPHRGGESVALKMLADYCNDSDYIGTFEKPKTAPTAFAPQSTTLLSPHLHFGSLSVRKFWWDVQAILEHRKKAKKPNSANPVNLPGQLLFRDMYFGAQAALGRAFVRTHGNKVARFIDWHLQSKHDSPDGGYTIDSPEAEEWFQRWAHGTTGFPWIDALMRQLRSEGWMHHLGRHAVACFLTRGGCYVSWERGASVFDTYLLDAEPACNAGNWMWLSCTAFYSMFYRVYSPVAFPRKWDPEGAFVRRYVPELARFDARFIYEPHRAPVADQKRWGCVVTGNGEARGRRPDGLQVYPKPMFDFAERRQICVDRIKKAYSVGLHGDDEMVVSGRWKERFDHADEGGGGGGGGATREDMSGVVHRGRKRKDPGEAEEAEGEVEAEADAEAAREEKEGKTNGAEGTVKKSKAAAKGAKKQTSLDAHVNRTGKT